MAGDGVIVGVGWGYSVCVCVCIVVVCVCARGKREGKVTRGGHFKQATTLALASAAVLNDCHVLVVSPSPPPYCCCMLSSPS